MRDFIRNAWWSLCFKIVFIFQLLSTLLYVFHYVKLVCYVISSLNLMTFFSLIYQFHRGMCILYDAGCVNILRFYQFVIEYVLHLFYFMSWKLTKETSAKIGVRRACRGSSPALPLILNYLKRKETYFVSPTGSCIYFTTLTGGRKVFFLTSIKWPQLMPHRKESHNWALPKFLKHNIMTYNKMTVVLSH